MYDRKRIRPGDHVELWPSAIWGAGRRGVVRHLEYGDNARHTGRYVVEIEGRIRPIHKDHLRRADVEYCAGAGAGP